MKALASFIMQGGRQATIVVATMAILSLLLPPLVIISAAGLSLVTLRDGWPNGLRVLVGSTVATSLIGYIVLGSALVSLSYLLMIWLPVFVVSLVLRETGELNKALECLVVISMLAVTAVYSFVDNPAQHWVEGVQGVITVLAEQQELLLTQAELVAALDVWSHYLTGFVVAGVSASILLSLLLGRWWQGLLFNPGGFNNEFKRFRLLPRDGVFFVILFAIAMLLDGQLAEWLWNLDIQVLLLFSIVGVSVVHVIVKSKGGSQFLIFIFYAAVFFVPHLIVPLIIIGLSDVWMNWRQRFISKV